MFLNFTNIKTILKRIVSLLYKILFMYNFIIYNIIHQFYNNKFSYYLYVDE